MRFTTVWRMVIVAAACLAEQSLAFCNDGDDCNIFKYTKCNSNMMHTVFMLDRSTSMNWGITCESSRCAVNCENAISSKYCVRKDIMRVVLRLFLERAFYTFDKECNEYLVSSDYSNGGTGGCKAAGMTDSPISFVWWTAESVSDKFVLKEETFRKPGGYTKATAANYEIGTLQKIFIDYFYDDDGAVRESRWGKAKNGDPIMNDAEIKKIFQI